MTRVLLISDTHGWLDPALHKHIAAADEVWHAGDIGTSELAKAIEAMKPLRAVYGNIDGADVRITYPEDLFFELHGVRVLMTHIAGSPGRFNARVKEKLKSLRPTLLVCGHSHLLKVQFDKPTDVLYMNPGAAGVHGFHHVRTALRFEVSAGEVKGLAVIELGPRSVRNHEPKGESSD